MITAHRQAAAVGGGVWYDGCHGVDSSAEQSLAKKASEIFEQQIERIHALLIAASFRAAIISQEKQQRDTSRPYSGYGDRHKSSGRFFNEGHGFLLDPNMITSEHLTGCRVPR